MADAVGSSCTMLGPILRLVEAHVLAAECLHGDDTTVPVLAKGKTETGRCWVYVRDDKPFGGISPLAAMFYYSRDRKGEHPQTHLAKYAGSSRPMPLMAMASSTCQIEVQVPSWRPHVGSMPGVRSLPWLISTRTLGERLLARRRSCSRLSRSRSCTASTPSLKSSGRSME
jgi:transposase